MRRWVVVLAVLAACGGSHPTATTSTTAKDTESAAYCRLMERTDPDARSGDPAKVVDAYAERVENSPDVLDQAWIDFAYEPTSRQGAAVIVDWTQEHCGFLPYVVH